MKRTNVDVLTDELVRHGVVRWHIDRTHPHPRLLFEVDGKPVFYVIPASGFDWRGMRNARADIRRILRSNAGRCDGR